MGRIIKQEIQEYEPGGSAILNALELTDKGT
jgi:hypothetical protein